MEAILLVAGIPIVFFLAVLFALKVTFGRWSYTWHGHEIELKNYMFHEALFVDGQQVGSMNGGGFMEYTIEDPEHGSVKVRSLLLGNGFSVTGHLFIDDEFVAGDPLVGDLQLPTAAKISKPAPAHHDEIPLDPRWQAAVTLMDDVRKLGADDEEIQPIVEHLFGRIKVTMLDLQELREAERAHWALDPDDNSMSESIEGAEELVKSVLLDLRELHLAIVAAKKPDESGHEVRDLVDRLRAEIEVQGPSKSAKPRVLPREKH
ncbi:MAG: hypothetical protein HN348_22065 [Proteobacteria bacterium]|nr:hypothetical protein [Pseudomonadota bacterium]